MFELPPPILSCARLNHSYGDRQILHDCALQLYAGECLAIVGASGSGKSTLLSLLAGRQPMQAGADYTLAGQDMGQGAAAQHLRKMTGYVGQNAASMLDGRLSAASNIASRLLDLGRRDAQAVLQLCCAWLKRLGLDEARFAEPVSQFSGGMQQRVQIAAALVHTPKVLFLDEPTTGLDTVAQSELLDVLRAIKQQEATAMVFVTHDLAAARLLADRVLVMEDGRIVEEALCDRLLAEPKSDAGRALVRAML